MNSIFIAAAAASFAGLMVWLLRKSREAALKERVQAREHEIARLSAEMMELRTDRARRCEENTRLATQLQAEYTAKERLTSEFKALSADALRANRSEFLEEAKSAFAQLQQQSEHQLERRALAIEGLVRPIRDSLEKVDAKMLEIEKARAGAYGALGEQLRALNVAQLQLQTEAARLSTALRSSTYAGSWGELQLRRVVEMADMMSYCDFVEQETAGHLRADMVVRLPGGQRIVVDAKVPLESFRLADAVTDEALRSSRLAEHAQKVRSHVDVLGAKNYWEHFQPAPEFVVLFLPGDHFLTAALQADNQLLDRALTKRVLLATPTTLIALLKAAAFGWRQDAISRNAEEVSALGRSLYDRIAQFAEILERTGRGLDQAMKGYNNAVGSFETMLLPGARKLAELGARGAKELNPPRNLDASARAVIKRT